MEKTVVYPASQADIPFIAEAYDQNIRQLHGTARSHDTWKKLLSDESSTYYIVKAAQPVAWFRTEVEDGILWLGMLQVHPNFQRQGFGRMVLEYLEQLAAEKNLPQIGIHTTEDNLPARALYQALGYTVSEIGPCTTADGIDRVGYTFLKDIL